MKQTQKENNNRKNTKVIPGCIFFLFKARRRRQERKLPEASNHSPLYSGGV